MSAPVTDRFVDTNGIRLFIAEAGRGRPLVFLHGLGWDHSLWRGVMGTFADRYRVIAGDTRGHGRSSKPVGPYTIPLFTADWAGALKRLGVDRACIVGFSQGGMVAQRLAVDNPEMIAALVLASTACRSDPAAKDKLEERIRLGQAVGPVASARLAAATVFSKGFMAARPDAIEEFVRWRADMEQEPLVHATRAAYGFDVADQLQDARVPTLVIYGEEDVLTPPHVVKAVAAHVPGAELVGVAGAGHMIPVEKPREFDALLEGFLMKHYPPTL
jgi:pimeloyl-ACP methyl ester carboxylesterase